MNPFQTASRVIVRTSLIAILGAFSFSSPADGGTSGRSEGGSDLPCNGRLVPDRIGGVWVLCYFESRRGYEGAVHVGRSGAVTRFGNLRPEASVGGVSAADGSVWLVDWTGSTQRFVRLAFDGRTLESYTLPEGVSITSFGAYDNGPAWFQYLRSGNPHFSFGRASAATGLELFTSANTPADAPSQGDFAGFQTGMPETRASLNRIGNLRAGPNTYKIVSPVRVAIIKPDGSSTSLKMPCLLTGWRTGWPSGGATFKCAAEPKGLVHIDGNGAITRQPNPNAQSLHMESNVVPAPDARDVYGKATILQKGRTGPYSGSLLVRLREGGSIKVVRRTSSKYEFLAPRIDEQGTLWVIRQTVTRYAKDTRYRLVHFALPS